VEVLPGNLNRNGKSDAYRGDVGIDDIAIGEEASRLGGSKVRFFSSARTARHTHPFAQALRGIDAADVVGVVIHDMLTGQGRIPRVEFSNGPFAVNIATQLASRMTPLLRAISGPGIEEASDDLIDALRPYRNVIDHLDGRLNFNVFAGDTTALMIRLRIVDGAIDFQRFAVAINASLPYHATAFVSLDFVVNGCDLELWLRTPSLPIQIPDAAQTVLSDLRIMSWHLASDEVRSVRDYRLLPLWRALHPDSADRTWVADRIASGLGGPSESLSIGSIDADLSLVNRNQIVLPLGGANEIVLAPNAVVHLKAAGGLRGRTASGSNLPGAIELISVDRATAARLHLAIGGRTVDTDSIEIREFSDTRISFSGLKPQMLTGRITSTTVNNFRWQLSRSPRARCDSSPAPSTAIGGPSGSAGGSGTGRPRSGTHRRPRGRGP
jgi:hypothetical protein